MSLICLPFPSRSGLPSPIDSIHSCCYFYSILPRPKFIATAGYNAYEYDSVMQETYLIGTTRQVFEAPIGAGFTLPSGITANDWGVFNTTALHYNADSAFRPYWFAGEHYWRWKPGTESSPSGVSQISTGWMTGINYMDAWVTIDSVFAYAIVSGRVRRFLNRDDVGDDSFGPSSNFYSQPLLTVFPNFPTTRPHDVDIHGGSNALIVLHEDKITLYDFGLTSGNGKLVAGYPTELHQDSVDGGTLGVGRTSCSGIQHLYTGVGFIEDKSPQAALRTLPYQADRVCKWVIHVPDNYVKSLADDVDYSGIEILLNRLDLSAGTTLRIYANNDLPSSDYLRAFSLSDNWWYDMNTVPSPARTKALGPMTYATDATPTLITEFTSTTTLPAGGVRVQTGAANSASYTVELSSDSTPVTGTGFGLTYSVLDVPTTKNHTAKYGLFWLSTDHQIRSTETIISPDIPALRYAPIEFGIHLSMYPNNVAAYYTQVSSRRAHAMRVNGVWLIHACHPTCPRNSPYPYLSLA